MEGVRPPQWPQQELTERILTVARQVSTELGWGFSDDIYVRALSLALTQEGLAVQRQVPLEVRFRGETVGRFIADLLIEDGILIEVKARGQLLPEHEAAALSHLKATGVRVGLLLDFGTPKLAWKRLYA